MSSCRIIIVGTSNYTNFVLVRSNKVIVQELNQKIKFGSFACENEKMTMNVYFVMDGKLCIVLNSYIIALFLNAISRSPEYRTAWLNHVEGLQRRIFVLEVLPKLFYLDKAWYVVNINNNFDLMTVNFILQGRES